MAERVALVEYAGERFSLRDDTLLRLARDLPLFPLPRVQGWITGGILLDATLAVEFDLGRWLGVSHAGRGSYQLLCRQNAVVLSLPVDRVAGIVPEGQGSWDSPAPGEAAPGCERVFVYRKLRYPLLDLEMMVRLLESN